MTVDRDEAIKLLATTKITREGCVVTIETEKESAAVTFEEMLRLQMNSMLLAIEMGA